MDILSWLLDKEIANLNFTPISRENVSISHLLFVDDTLVFNKANICTLLSLRHVFLNLEKFYELSINTNQSFIHFTTNTSDAAALSSMINLHIETFLFKYLKNPLMNKQLNASNFNSLIDKIFAWLAG